MKYSKEFAQKVLKANDIVLIISDYVELKQEKDHYIGKCPFDKKGIDSLVVFPETNSFKCFECGEGGNAAAFIMKKENITFDEALEKLAKKAGITPTEKDFRENSDQVLTSLLKKVYHDAATFYVKKLNSDSGKDGMSYLKTRKLTDTTIKNFGLGFAPPKGNGLYKHLHKLGYSDDLLLKAGLIRISETGPYDFFRNRVMFPIVNADNDVVAFSGRVMDDGKPKYLNSPESPIFNKGNTFYGMNLAAKNIRRDKAFLVCEGQLDVISLHQAGFRTAIAPMGTAMTQAHVPFITERANRVYLTSDSDAAGQKAIMRAIKNLSGTNVKISVVDLQPYKDPDEFIKNEGKESYRERLYESISAEDFIIKNLSEKFNLSKPEDREKYLKETVDAIISLESKREIENEIERK